MTRYLLLGSFLAAPVLGGCTLISPTTPVSEFSARLDVSELAVRAIYADAARSDMAAAICFPAFKDPDQAFLGRLAPLRAAPCSALTTRSTTRPQVIAKTGERAITIYIERISFIDASTVTVDASEWMEALNSGGYVFKFRLVGGKWQLADQTVTWQG